MSKDDVFKLRRLADWFDLFDKRREITANVEAQWFLRDLANRLNNGQLPTPKGVGL